MTEPTASSSGTKSPTARSRGALTLDARHLRQWHPARAHAAEHVVAVIAPPPVTEADPPQLVSRRPVATSATTVVGIGMAIIVGRDGSPVWQALRLLVVAVVVAGVLALLLAQRRRTTWRSILPALAVSFVAVPVGIGIGGPHLAKAGLTVQSIAGLLTLVGGVVLFGAAIAWTVRSTRRRIGWPASAVVTLTLLLLCWTLGQAVAATNVPRPAVGSRTPADVGFVSRDVTFPATDGVSLSGWYVPSRNRAAVVLLHGAGSTRSDVLDHAVVLARHGYGVLLFDARGHGRSGGRAMDFGWFGDQDIGGAVAFLSAQPDVDPSLIAAVGMSMGGEQAIGAAATIDRIKAVVAEGATNRVAADKEWLSDEYGMRGSVSTAIESLTYRFADLLSSASPPISLHDAVAAAAPRPVLLIAAGDVADEARAGRYIQSGSPGTVEIWVVPNTEHVHGLDTHPAEWESRVMTFLDGALGITEEASG